MAAPGNRFYEVTTVCICRIVLELDGYDLLRREEGYWNSYSVLRISIMHGNSRCCGCGCGCGCGGRCDVYY